MLDLNLEGYHDDKDFIKNGSYINVKKTLVFTRCQVH